MSKCLEKHHFQQWVQGWIDFIQLMQLSYNMNAVKVQFTSANRPVSLSFTLYPSNMSPLLTMELQIPIYEHIAPQAMCVGNMTNVTHSLMLPDVCRG